MVGTMNKPPSSCFAAEKGPEVGRGRDDTLSGPGVLRHLDEAFAQGKKVDSASIALHFFDKPASSTSSNDSDSLRFVAQCSSGPPLPPPSILYQQQTACMAQAQDSHDRVVGVLKSLETQQKVSLTAVDTTSFYLTEEGLRYALEGSPEAVFARLVFQELASQAKHLKRREGGKETTVGANGEEEEKEEAAGVDAHVVKQKLGDIAFDLGMKSAVKNRWIEVRKSDKRLQAVSNCLTIHTLLLPAPTGQAARDAEGLRPEGFPSQRDSTKTSVSASETDPQALPELATACTVPYIFDLVEKYLYAIGDLGRTALSAPLGGSAEIVKNRMQREQQKWRIVTQKVEHVVSEVTARKVRTEDDTDLILQEFRKRKLVECRKVTNYIVSKGPDFSLSVDKKLADVTQAMIQSGSWSEAELKPYNFFACGKRPTRGSIHPLNRSLLKLKNVLQGLGFEEMATNRWVEPSFWNFDALFQPQQHPSRNTQDTFFLKHPAMTESNRLPSEYVERVKEVHEHGGFGSIGYRYDWSLEESQKNVLRTHTTAVTAKLLCKMAEETKRTGKFVPRKYFSIDRVFRNESIDATHLAEFHQVEGLVADHGMGIGHLIGILQAFYKRIGISKLRVKPAYNPYTEPSMEVYGYHQTMKKWIEVGNSGFFRPEMLLPMGLPEDVTVMAWGLSLERPTMIKYNISNIRDLFGYKAAILGTV